MDPLAQARDGVQLILDILGPESRLPARFWDDPFVLGFIYYSAHAYAVGAGATDDDMEKFPSLYISLLEGDGIDVLQRSVDLQKAKDADFTAGAMAAEKFTSVLSGATEFDDDPIVKAARERAAEAVRADDWQELTESQALFVYLYDGFFASELRRRFPEMTERQQ